MEKLYHIQLDDSHGARYAILPGDPGRVEKIAALLEQPRLLGVNREYTTWIGDLEGEPVLVMSTGMGGPSTAIGVEELFMTGVRNFVRVGTSAHEPRGYGGDLASHGSIRMKAPTGISASRFPAVADFELTGCLVKGGPGRGLPMPTGVQCRTPFTATLPDRMRLYDSKINGGLVKGRLASEWRARPFTCLQTSEPKPPVLNTIWNQERRSQGWTMPDHDTCEGSGCVEAIGCTCGWIGINQGLADLSRTLTPSLMTVSTRFMPK